MKTSSAIYAASLFLAVMPLAAYAEQPTQQSIIKLQQQRQSGPASTSIEQVIIYDYLEDGELKGGVVQVEPSNLFHTQVAPIPLAPTPYPVTTILDSGSPSNRIDIVVVGDGYTTNDLDSYSANTHNVISNFFSESPLLEYQSFYNVHRVDVTSNQSGVDNDPSNGIEKDTALDMGYWCGGTERLLCVNVSKAKSAASNAADVDQVLALANSTKYGGAGYPGSNLGTVAGQNGSAVETAIHEFGHSFADLADEYSYGGSETYSGPEFSAVNVSILQYSDMLSQQNKWYRWLGYEGVDTYEGGNYHLHGVFRPTNNSKMRSLGNPFGPVNIEQFIIKIYQTVNPIDSATSAGSYVRGKLLQVSPMQPSDHDLDIQWWVDGVLQTNTDSQFDTNTLPNDSLNHSVSVRVVDNTPLVRDESARATWMTAEMAWTITPNTPTEQTDLTISQKGNSTLGWAEPFQFWKSSETGTIDYTINISNAGPSLAENVVVQSQLPANIVHLSSESEQGSCFEDNGTIACSLGSLSENSSTNINVIVETSSKDRIPFSASVSSDTTDTDMSNNATVTKFGGPIGALLVMVIGLLSALRRPYIH